MQCESPINYDKKVMAKVKVFVRATDVDADVDCKAVTLAPRDFSVYFNLGPGSSGIGKFASF